MTGSRRRGVFGESDDSLFFFVAPEVRLVAPPITLILLPSPRAANWFRTGAAGASGGLARRFTVGGGDTNGVTSDLGPAK